ncbi:DUF4124 domain-containing protein [Flocculibacter collagenilyticus]|uniref:DUF4124 domain-containing protein n=1 Tax=Flocculibacter collagenilyticus TaxID=2744479 RepID=UPI0018F5F2BC|nr:DUF4124 domain-containing protein [Flocculibacter collagenilyticus]
MLNVKTFICIVISTFVYVYTTSLLASASSTTVYRWVDERGVIHFSQTKPASGEYKKMEVEERISPAVSSSNLASNNDNSGNSLAAEFSEKASQFCQRAKLNVELLSSNEEIQIRDKRGEYKTLSPREVKQQRALAKRQVSTFCGGTALTE